MNFKVLDDLQVDSQLGVLVAQETKGHKVDLRLSGTYLNPLQNRRHVSQPPPLRLIFSVCLMLCVCLMKHYHIMSKSVHIWIAGFRLKKGFTSSSYDQTTAALLARTFTGHGTAILTVSRV